MERAELENAEVAGDDDEEEVEGMEGDFNGGEGTDHKIEFNNKGAEHNDKEEDISEEENWIYIHKYSNNKIYIW